MLKNFLNKYSKKITSLLIIDILFIIWKTIRIILGPGYCKFIPSCSYYSRDAIKKYGIFKGSYFSIKRLLKCNPFTKGGYDPVP